MISAVISPVLKITPSSNFTSEIFLTIAFMLSSSFDIPSPKKSISLVCLNLDLPELKRNRAPFKIKLFIYSLFDNLYKNLS